MGEDLRTLLKRAAEKSFAIKATHRYSCERSSMHPGNGPCSCGLDDNEAPNVTLELPAPKQARCLGCQQFMKDGGGLPLHDDRCASLYFVRRRKVAA